LLAVLGRIDPSQHTSHQYNALPGGHTVLDMAVYRVGNHLDHLVLGERRHAFLGRRPGERSQDTQRDSRPSKS